MFDTQCGLTLHFHNANNLFCNLSPQYWTRTSEQSVLSELSPLNDMTDRFGKEDDDQEDVNDTFFQCWSALVQAILMMM
jgi:hypothetical protein